MNLTIRLRAVANGFILTGSKFAIGKPLAFLTLLIRYEEDYFCIYCASGKRFAF